MPLADQMNPTRPIGRAPGVPVPAEGDGGGFTQSWFPVCPSSEVGRGQVVGREFLDGEVIVARAEDGACAVLSAYCVHVGANLKVGTLVGGAVECAFHKWRYDLTGRCVATGSGDRPPRRAGLFRFPSQEKWGLIWAFNGEEPLFDIPDFAHPQDGLTFDVVDMGTVAVDPWVVMCNTLDLQHLRIVHGMEFANNPEQSAVWNRHSVFYDIRMNRRDTGIGMDVRLGVVGSNIFYRSGRLEGRYIGSLTPLTIRRPGVSQIYLVQATIKGDGSEQAREQARQFIEASISLSKEIIAEDAPIMNSIRFAPGYLTKSDRMLSRFLDHLRTYPRAHPSAGFIR